MINPTRCEDVESLESFVRGSSRSEKKYFEVQGRKVTAWYEIGGRRYTHEYDASNGFEIELDEKIHWDDIEFTDMYFPYIMVTLPDSTQRRKYFSLEGRAERLLLERLLYEQYDGVPSELKEMFNEHLTHPGNKDNAFLFCKYMVMRYLREETRDIVYKNRVRISNDFTASVLDAVAAERIQVYISKFSSNGFLDLSWKPVQALKRVVN